MAGPGRQHDRKRASTKLLWRAGTLVLAFMAASAQMAEVVHYALVPHTVCAEHGEVIHSDARARSAATNAHTHTGSASLASDATRAESRAAWLPVTTEASDQHDHCLLSALRKQDAAVLSASAVFIPQGSREGSAVFARELAPLQAIAVLDQAPRNSPPSPC